MSALLYPVQKSRSNTNFLNKHVTDIRRTQSDNQKRKEEVGRVYALCLYHPSGLKFDE
jgi:hypothetical protein